MKTIRLGWLLLLWAVSASAQVDYNYSVNPIYLTSTGTTTIASISTGSAGILKSIGCYQGYFSVAGSPTATLKISLDGGVHTTSYALYSGSNGWSSAITPFATHLTSGQSAGSYQFDTFLLPLYVPYTSSGLTVSLQVTTAGTSGWLSCYMFNT
jgi:hypothetical protein